MNGGSRRERLICVMKTLTIARRVMIGTAMSSFEKINLNLAVIILILEVNYPGIELSTPLSAELGRNSIPKLFKI